MKESGLVIKCEGEVAIVRVNKKSECSKCGMCAFPKNVNHVDIRAKNPLNAKQNDNVTITRPENGKLTSTILAFLVPLILIVIACVISLVFIKKEIFIVIISLPSIAIWYIILALIDKKLAFLKKFCAEIIQINNEIEK